MFCTKCGQALPSEAEFCLKCGHDLRKAKEVMIKGKGVAQSQVQSQAKPSEPVRESHPTERQQGDSPRVDSNYPRQNRVTPFPEDEIPKKSPFVWVLMGAVVACVLVWGAMEYIVSPQDKEETIEQEKNTGTAKVPYTEQKTETNTTPIAPTIDPEELYEEILKTIRQVANDKYFDHSTVGLPYYLSWEENPLSKMGYDFVDVNGDEIPELFVVMGDSSVFGNNSTLLSSYTIIDEEAVPLIESGERFGCHLSKDLFFCEWGWHSGITSNEALLKLNKDGEMEYVTYIYRTVEDDNDWSSPTHDYMTVIENNVPNFANRRIATEAELAEFKAIYEGEKYQFDCKPFVTESEEVSSYSPVVRQYDLSNAPFPYLRIAVPDFVSFFSDGEYYTDPNSIYYDGYNTYIFEYSPDTSIHREAYIQYLVSLGFNLLPEGQDEGYFMMTQQQGDDFVVVAVSENYYTAIDPKEYVRVSISMS